MSIEKSAIEFLEHLPYITDVGSLNRLFLKYAEPMGVEYVLGGVVFARKRMFRPNILIGSQDHSWFQHYSDEKLYRYDAILPRMCSSNANIVWSDLAKNRSLTSEEKDMLLRPRDFGLRDGLAVPLHMANGEMGTITAAGAHFVPDAVIEAALRLMSYHAYQRMIQILDEVPVLATAPKLTRRQMQCLTLVAEGKTSQEISDRIEISKHTVKEHVEKVMEIFDVGSRIEAVVAAHRENLLDL